VASSNEKDDITDSEESITSSDSEYEEARSVETPKARSKSFTLKLNEEMKTPQGQVEKQKFLNDTNPALHKYINHMLAGDNKGIDTIYGLKYNMNSGNWTMGSKIITFGVDDIYVGNKAYKGTQGLFELLFASEPVEAYITENDREAYKSILQRNNAHRRNLTSHSRLNYT
jgi:hypothetical protein